MQNLHQLFDWQYIGTNNCWRFCKLLWPSQNIWTLSQNFSFIFWKNWGYKKVLLQLTYLYQKLLLFITSIKPQINWRRSWICGYVKVRTFWEAHKNLHNALLSKRSKCEEDFFSNFVCFSESPHFSNIYFWHLSFSCMTTVLWTYFKERFDVF